MRVVHNLVLALAAVLLATSNALAGPPELLTQIAIHPTDPDRMVLRYVEAGDGLIYSFDGGDTWVAVPACVIAAGGTRPLNHGRTAIASDGTTFMGSYTNLFLDDGTGCGFGPDANFTDQWISDLVGHPSDPDVLFALLSTAPNGVMNGIHRRDADGTWHAVGQLEDVLLGRLHVVELMSGELRFYQSGSRGVLGDPPMTRPDYFVRVSDDGGETWTEHSLEDSYGPIVPNTVMELQGVDPVNPDRILVTLQPARAGSTPGNSPVDTVLLSDDQGATFQEYVLPSQFGGLDLAPDGRVWIADMGDNLDPEAPSGLFYAASLDESPTRIYDARDISCLDYQADPEQLFVCLRDEAGIMSVAGSDYTKRFDFREVESLVMCDGVDLVAECRMQLLTGWCGASHFPQAPLCCPYPDRVSLDANLMPGEMPEFETNCPDAGVPMGSGGSGGVAATSGTGGAAATGGTGAESGGAGGQAGGSAAAGGDVTPTGGGGGGTDDGGSGCGCRAPGGTQGSSGATVLLAGIVLAALRRRRLRGRRRG